MNASEIFYITKSIKLVTIKNWPVFSLSTIKLKFISNTIVYIVIIRR